MVEDVVHEEHGQFPSGLQVELPLLPLLALPFLLPFLLLLLLPFLQSLFNHSPNGQRLAGMLGLQPAPQRLKLLLGHEVAPVLVGEPNEGRDEDGEDEPSVELEILLVGYFAEQLVEAHVVEEGRRVVGGLEVVLQVFDRDLALDPLGAQPLEDGTVIGPRGYEESEVLVAGLEVLLWLVLGPLY